MKTQKEQIALVNQTVRFYKKNPRSRTSNSCMYTNPETKAHCAVGRCMTKKTLDQLLEEGKNTDGIVDMGDSLGKHFDDLFLKKYKGFTEELWEAIQGIHDENSNWYELSPSASSRELTKSGKHNVETVIKRIEKNFYE